MLKDLELRLAAKATSQNVPLNVGFELTPLCPMACDVCYIRTSAGQVAANGGLRSVDEWLALARQLKEMGTLYILLTGGEPMAYPGFGRLYEELHRMGFLIRINTNGTLLTKELCQLLGRLKPRCVNVTLYGASEQTYADLCHYPEGYRRCTASLAMLKEAGVNTVVNYSTTRKNIADLPKAYQTADELGLPIEVVNYMCVALRQPCEPRRNIGAARLSPAEAALCDVNDLRRRRQVEYRQTAARLIDCVNGPEPYGTAARPALSCRGGRSSAWVDWHHRLSACVHLRTPGADLRQVSMAEAWRRVVDETARLQPVGECAGCRRRSICPACYATAWHEKRGSGSLDYLCQMAAEKERLLGEAATA